MTYRRALALLAARRETHVELGLERLRAHLARLGSPQRGLPVFHVAGTNGKGSTCALLASALREAGYKTGLYTSPHLLSPRERIQVDGRMIAEAAFARALERALSAERPGAGLTYFELLTAAAFLHFRGQACDVAVLETGLGGRLDATNVVERPLACVISSIDYDHMAYLGDTIEAIAREKAGIVKASSPLVCAPLRPRALRVMRAAAAAAGAPLSLVRRPWPCLKADWAGGRQTLRAPFGELRLRLLGGCQGLNAALAYRALKAASRRLPVGDERVRRGFERAQWPARFQVVRFGAKTAILDGAHNPEAMRHLARTWRRSPWSRRRALWIVGMLRDKDARGLLKPIAPLLREAVAVTPPSPRALPAEKLARLLRKAAPRARVSVEPDAARALRGWRRRRDLPTAVVCGSFYLAASALKSLSRNDKAPGRPRA
ncbi:MAG: bifunctional folylpolyglutamate synthase/dihydrofolate synthase [Elusimicrobia bacterium]|nr:bifunctional folylpolyglutamate synthase/dihydrofolate synthase [Elusimicrobiota bacterium]MDE2426634.1 bifunctional folylpolyglutamate synthase/dihydrofolate synthase [Elusimicrobiota bacterium]